MNINIASLFFALATLANAASVDGILRLCQAGVAEDIVVAAAKQSSATNLTVEQILAVKQICKTDNIVRAMMGGTTTVPALPVNKSALVAQLVGSGIFLDDGRAIEPTTFGKVATAGKSMIKMGLTGGFKKSQQKAEIRGDKAAIRTPRQPSFISGINPKELVVVHLESRGGRREIIVGEMGIGQSEGFREEDLIPFSSEKMGEGRYKITLAKVIESGEYAFFQGSVDRGGPLGSRISVAGSVYDFGVD